MYSHHLKNGLRKKICALTKNIILVGIFCFGYSLEANQENKEQITSQYTDQFKDANDTEKAIRSYKELLNTNISPADKRLIQLDLAKAYVLTKQFPLALAEYDKLLVDNPKDCQVRQTIVDLYLSFARYDAKNNNHQSALNWYVAAIGLDPGKRTLLLREYADEVSKSGNGPGAVTLYKEILSNASSSPEDRRLVNLGLAQTYIWLNNHQEALNIYDALLKIDPLDNDARKGKAQVYLDYARFDRSKGNQAQAIDWFKKAVEANPDGRLAILKELADLLTYNTQFDEAIVLYHEILNNHPEGDRERETRLSLAKVYTEKFLYDDALKEYEALLMQNKYDARAKQGKARVYIDFATYNSRLSKHREAVKWYYKAIENDPIIRPELLLKIEQERAFLGEKDNPPKSPAEIDIEACLGNSSSKIEGIPPEQKTVPANPEKIDENQKLIPAEQKTIPVIPEKTDETPKSIPATNHQFEKQTALSIQTPPSAKELAKQAFEEAHKYAKFLEIFQANRAFETSLALDPENKNYREQYAWHLQAFFFRPEALFQFLILLPDESEKTAYYEVLGWDYRILGKLKESIWAFSNLYSFPCYLTLNNKYIMANKFYHSTYYAKIWALWDSLVCANEREVLEIKKNFSTTIVIWANLKRLLH